ncbi:MAG: hypothetical protein DIU70_012235 [Bacillota bacterium]
MYRRVWGEERGSYAVEYLGMLPLILLTGTLLWQIALAGYTVVVAQFVAQGAATAAAQVPWEDAEDRALLTLAAAAPAHLGCRLEAVERRPVAAPAAQPPLELLEIEVTCQIPPALRLGHQVVPMPRVTRTARVPWAGP